MNRVNHFEISSKNPRKTMEFYKKTFGWKFKKWDGPFNYWAIITGKRNPGINGGLMHGNSKCIINTIEVSNIDKFIKRIEKNKGKIKIPKTPIPGVGYLAYFKDPEGNEFGLMEEDKSAI